MTNKKILRNTLILLTCMASTGCKKSVTKQDCEINNYGTVKIIFQAVHSADNYRIQLDNNITSTNGASEFSVHRLPGTVHLKIINFSQGTFSESDISVEVCREIVLTASN